MKRRARPRPISWPKVAACAAAGGMFLAAGGTGASAAGRANARLTGGVQASGIFATYSPTGYLPTADWNPFSTSSTVLQAVGPVAFSPLAFTQPTAKNNGNTYTPQLATHWNYQDDYHQFVVHLRPHLKWSNGAPLTSKDVVVTWKADALTGAWGGLDITNVTAPNKTTVVFTRSPLKGTPPYNAGFESAVLGTVIDRAVLYQKFIPPTAEFNKMVSTLWNPNTELTSGPVYTKYEGLLTKAAKALTQYNPGKAGLVSAGPYTVQHFSPSTVICVKNPLNWAAKKVHVAKVEYYNQVSTEATNNELVAGDFDAVGYQPDTPLYRSIMARNRGVMHYVKVPGYLTTNGIYMNFKIAPFNKVQVRQAFLYLLDDKGAMQASDPIAGVPTKASDGEPTSVTDYYLTPKQQKALNPYKRNPAKAAKLLKQAGLKKVGKTWHLPSGKAFHLTVYSATTLQSWDLLASNVASQLTSFGIPTKVALAPVTSFGTQTEQGRYALFAGYVGGDPYPPWGSFGTQLETYGGWEFTPNGTQEFNKADPGYGIPKQSMVPGVGMVNPSELAYQLNSTPNQATVRADAYKMMAWMNYNAYPGVLYFQDQSILYSTKNFSDWPLKNQTLMRYIGYGSADYFIAAATEAGYLRAKR